MISLDKDQVKKWSERLAFFIAGLLTGVITMQGFGW
jgi:hypothetical protein